MVFIAAALRRRLSGQFTLRVVQLPFLVPVLLVALLFKLAISDGGGHLPSLTFTQVAVLLMVGVVVWSSSRPHVGALSPVLATLVVIGASLLWSVRPDSTVREFLLWSSYASIFALVAWTLSGLAAARRFLDAAVVIVGWVCLVGLYLYWGSDGSIARWYSTFYWPNPFAAFILLVLPLEVVRCAHARGAREALAHGMMSVMVGVPFVLTYSRGAWLSLLAILPLAGLVLRPPSWAAALRRVAMIAALTVVLAASLSYGGRQDGRQRILSRAASLSDADDFSIQGRLHFWRAGSQIFLAHPILGTGAGTYAYASQPYQSDIRFYSRSAHNLYLGLASEIGLVGIVPFFAFLAALAALWIRGLARAKGTEAYPLVTGVGLGLAAFLVHSGLDMNFDFPANPAMAFAFAGVLAWYDASAVRVDSVARRVWIPPRVWKSALMLVLALMVVTAGVRLVADRHFREARVLAARGHWPAAAAELQRAARLSPLNPDYIFGWGEAMQRVSPESRRVVAAMRRGMGLDSSNAYFPINLARALLARSPTPDETVEAEALLRHGLRLNPFHFPEAYGMLAGIYGRRGDPAAADRVYQDAMAGYFGHDIARDRILRVMLWPRVAELYMGWARSLEVRGHRAATMRTYEAILDEDPRYVPAYLAAADLALQEYRIADASGILARGLDQVPESELLWLSWRTLPGNRTAIWEQ